MNIQQIQLSDDGVTAAPLSPPDTRYGTPATAGYSIPAASKITILMIDSVSSEKQKARDSFRASLDVPLILDGVEAVPRGAEIHGRLVDVNN